MSEENLNHVICKTKKGSHGNPRKGEDSRGLDDAMERLTENQLVRSLIAAPKAALDNIVHLTPKGIINAPLLTPQSILFSINHRKRPASLFGRLGVPSSLVMSQKTVILRP